MLKRFLITCLFFSQTCVFANFNDILVVDIQYDWINKSEVEKEALIEEVHDILFATPLEKQRNFKAQFKDKIQDSEYRKHYLAASAGYKEIDGYNIAAFYYKKMKSIYMYALQDKKDVYKNYYYDALGNLKFIDFLSGDYPDYPYTAIQYHISGKPVSAIYYVSKDCQYLFKPNGEFEGVWYKYNLYNKKSKVTLTRTTY